MGFLQGRVREVTENYTVNYTSPSNGFDCHVSEQLSSVSANTSSFLAFERTQVRLLPPSTIIPPSHMVCYVAFNYQICTQCVRAIKQKCYLVNYL